MIKIISNKIISKNLQTFQQGIASRNKQWCHEHKLISIFTESCKHKFRLKLLTMVPMPSEFKITIRVNPNLAYEFPKLDASWLSCAIPIFKRLKK